MEGDAGVDWAPEKHDVLVTDVAGEKLLAGTFAHNEKGLRSLCRQLVRLGVRLVAVERPDGLLGGAAIGRGTPGAGVASQPGRGRAQSLPRVGLEVRRV